jgi:hypothetical protein
MQGVLPKPTQMANPLERICGLGDTPDPKPEQKVAETGCEQRKPFTFLGARP